MTPKQRDEVYALALLAAMRKMIKTIDITDEAAIQANAETLFPEVKNIITEHLNPEDILEIAAASIVASIGHSMHQVCEISIHFHGSVNVEGMIKAAETVCSHALGREVKVIQED